MKFELPTDVLNRKKYSQMTKGDIIKETKLSIQKLNRRIARLEKTGFAEYSKSLTRLQDYLKEEYGTKRFSSKHLINASFEERVKFLTQLKHFEGYHLLVSDVKEQIKNEIQTIHDRTEYTLTDKQLLTLNKAMKEYRKAVGSSEIQKYMDSETARQVFTDYVKKFSNDEASMFLDDLQEYLDTEETIYIRDFIDNYNVGYRGPVAFSDITGIPYNPITYKTYDEWKEQTEYDIDPATEVLYSGNGEMYRYNEDGELVEIK